MGTFFQYVLVIHVFLWFHEIRIEAEDSSPEQSPCYSFMSVVNLSVAAVLEDLLLCEYKNEMKPMFKFCK